MAARPPKLPVWRSVGESYRLVCTHRGQLTRIMGLWLAVMAPVYLLLHSIGDAFAQHQPTPFRSLFDFWLSPLIELPFFASIAVAWHRLILQGETVATYAYLRLDRLVWRFAGLSALLLAIWLGPATLLWILLVDSGQSEFASAATVALAPILVICAFFIVPRLSMALPGLAVGGGMSLAYSWRLARGNSWRLAIGTVASGLPALAGIVVIGLLIDGLPGNVVLSLAYATLIIFGVAFLSVAYRHFTTPDIVPQNEIQS